MDIGSIFLILAILIPVVIYIIRPLMERYVVSPIVSDQNLSTLLAQRDQVVSAIKELDDDYNLGKIPSDIYPTQRQTLLQSGVEILHRIDSHGSLPSLKNPEDSLEAAIISRSDAFDGATAPARKNGNAVPPVPDDDLEQRIASHRRLKQGKAGGFCPKCGKPVQATDRFCPKCGATLA